MNNNNISSAKKDEEYEFKGFKFYSSSFNTSWFNELSVIPKVILDIGAYDFGDSIRYKNEFTNCSVFGFEADKVRYEKTKKYANECGIKTYNKAVFSHTGTIDFYPAKCMIKDAGSFHSAGEYGGQGSVYLHNDNYKKRFSHISQDQMPIKTDCISIIEFCKNEKIYDISLVQIDVEGAEYEVIKGFGDIRPKLVFVEIQDSIFKNNIDKDETHNLLISMGYTLIKDLIVDKLYMYKN